MMCTNSVLPIPQVLAICMFATTAGYNSMFSFEMTCSSAKAATRSETVGYNFGYPFRYDFCNLGAMPTATNGL